MSDGRLDLGPLTVMEAVRTALDSLTLTVQDSGKNRTKALKTKLCECGRELGCRVSASGVGFGGEWLYDVTWTEYSRGYEPGIQNQMLDVHLVAECEWGNFAEVKKDFEKLLLARATLRLMVYDGNQDPGSDAIADQLAKYITHFRGTLDPDAWLLASLERDADTGGFSFRFFGVDKMNARAGGFGLFAPGIDWSLGVEGRKNLEEMMRQHEAIEAADREHKRRARTQQSLSGLRFKL